jgi:hypothetical protein
VEWIAMDGLARRDQQYEGDPFAITIGPDRSDYFGIGEDGAMYYTT